MIPGVLSAAPVAETHEDEPEPETLVVAVVPIPVRDGPRGGASAYIVPCHGCGHNFRIAARTLRDLRKDGRVPYCDLCRRPCEVRVTEADRRFWQDRFAPEAIEFLGWAMFTPRGTPPPRLPREDLALAASAARRR